MTDDEPISGPDTPILLFVLLIVVCMKAFL